MASTINATTSSGIVATADNTGSLALQTSGTTAVTIDTSQNVGIGTSSPSAYGLSVYKASGSSGSRYSSGANNFEITINGTDAYISNGSAGPVQIWTNGSERMRIDSSGNVGVNGTPATSGSTAQKLQAISTGIYVESYTYTGGRTNYWTAGAEGTGTNSYHVYTAGNTGVYIGYGATSWTGFSDTRLKNITGTYTNALNGLMQLEPIKFTWKSDDTNKPCVGVSAQSVENVVPEAVDKNKIAGSNDDTEYLAVRYTELIPIMIAAIQEQQTIINDLKARIEVVEAK